MTPSLGQAAHVHRRDAGRICWEQGERRAWNTAAHHCCMREKKPELLSLPILSGRHFISQARDAWLIKCQISWGTIIQKSAVFVCTGEGQVILWDIIKEQKVILLTEPGRKKINKKSLWTVSWKCTALQSSGGKKLPKQAFHNERAATNESGSWFCESRLLIMHLSSLNFKYGAAEYLRIHPPYSATVLLGTAACPLDFLCVCHLAAGGERSCPIKKGII